MTHLERFLNVMEYRPVDRLPNWEYGAWGQTIERWKQEGLNVDAMHWDMITGVPELHLDPREYIHIDTSLNPPFEVEVLERTDRHEIIRSPKGIVTKALIEGTMRGTRMSMDQYLSWPVTCQEDFDALKKRLDPTEPRRLDLYWEQFRLEGWKRRTHPLVLGENCTTLGFYWRMRDWMGTENLSYAFYDDPDLVHDMCNFHADFLIEVTRPILDKVAPDFMFVNEDMAMKNGPLLSPELYREFIFPHMRRLVEVVKSKGVKYVVVDSDGNPEPLIPLLMEAGVDAIWPMERASEGTDPLFLRKKYGRDLRLWGGIDKREIAKGRDAIDAHLRSLIPLVEDGGFIPTIDHTIPPDVSLDTFWYYMEKKEQLLNFEFDKI